MRFPASIGAKAFVLVFPLSIFAANAQQNTATLSDGGGVDFTGRAKATRTVDHSHPVPDGAEIAVSNRFGKIRLSGWDSRVLRVSAEITVGADNEDQAERLAEAVDVEVVQDGSFFDVRTVSPEVCECTIDMVVEVPRDADVIVENFFGDTFIGGLDGNVTLDSRYGIVELRDIGGLVKARARGEFPFVVRGLRRGGVFMLRSSAAIFSDIAGSLTATNYLGSIDVHGSDAAVDMDLSSENGAIHFYLPPGARPAIEASALYGAIESSLPLGRGKRGQLRHARLVNPDAAQQISLHTTFSSIFIDYEEETAGAASPEPATGDELVQDVVSNTYPAADGIVVIIEAVTGNIRVEGVDEETLTVTVTKQVRLKSVKNAQLALEGLAVRVDEKTNLLHVRSFVQEDLEALGCTSHRTDLLIRCPRTATLRILAEDGETYVAGTGAPIHVKQLHGSISIEHAKGVLDLSNEQGDILVTDCAGPVTVGGGNGTVTLRNVYGDMNVTWTNGKIVVDTAHAGVRLRNKEGDVRIIALEGIGGNYDVSVTNGNLSMAVPQTADATFLLTAHGGAIRSAIPVTGAIEGDAQSFQGRLNNGAHRVILETHNGDIVLD